MHMTVMFIFYDKSSFIFIRYLYLLSTYMILIDINNNNLELEGISYRIFSL